MTFEQWWDAEGRDIFQRGEGYRVGRAAWHAALAQRPEATTRESALEEAAKLCDSHVMHSETMKERAAAAMDDDSAAQWGAMRLAQERLADAIRDLKRAI